MKAPLRCEDEPPHFRGLLGHNDDEESLVCTSVVPNEFEPPPPPQCVCAFPTVLHTLVIVLQEVCLQGNGFRSLDNDVGHQCNGAAYAVRTTAIPIAKTTQIIMNHPDS
jgi:hypothetical protein